MSTNLRFCPLKCILFTPEGRKILTMKRKFIKFRVSNTELLIIRKKAEQCGLSMSDYVRSLSLNYTVKARLTEEEIEQYKLLNKYADNFRRITNLFKLGDTTGFKKLSTETAILFRNHLQKFK